MRAHMVLFAFIVAVLMLAVPMTAVIGASDASVDDKSSAVYFESKDGLSYEEINKYIDLEMTDDLMMTILKSTSDFKFDSDGFSISGISTSGYYVERGMAALINDDRYQSDSFIVVEMNVEFTLKANKNHSELFARTFNGDAAYGFDSHVSVKQNDTITFKGTLRTECSEIIEKNADSYEGRYVIQKSKFEDVESTELVLNATYRSSSGMEQTFSFKNSFVGHDLYQASFDFDTNEIKSLALGNVVVADEVIDVSGKGNVSMTYEGREYTAESRDNSYLTVYDGSRSDESYIGKETCTVTDEILMTEEQYKSMYNEVKLKDLFNNFTGTDQALLEQIGSVGSVTIGDLGKVESRAEDLITDIAGDTKDTGSQKTIALIGVMIAIIVVLVAALIIIKRRKNKW